MASQEIAWVAGPIELAHLLHVNRATLTAWIERRDKTGFPEELPAGSAYDLEDGLARGPLFDAREVIGWYTTWKPIKGPKTSRGYVDEQILTELGIEPNPQGASNGQ